ncbi:MAG: 16S rRNA (adenine(1518)-N(6)/adenine(1519)-N(6))-dimethyltransferase RsmA [Bacteroidales bacterium]|nr:16S rRNA (adenine(1518)-N(6)/adenine(1519)-N(6))-dimethyltransferase RsmA [Bacteroidales bacterium]
MKLKKSLGQHFLIQPSIAQKIISLMLPVEDTESVLEIGPGRGALTRHLLHLKNQLWLIEKDVFWVEYLKKQFPDIENRIICGDVLEFSLSNLPQQPVHVIGNMPYNISGPLLFMAIEQKDNLVEWLGMLQKEVVERIIAHPGTKSYGILSVLLQIFFHVKKHFVVSPFAFQPPPQVNSAVIQLVPKKITLPCPEQIFITVVKHAFKQRRKKLSNALKGLPLNKIPNSFANKRAEELNPQEFVELSTYYEL